jgi:hypothetical protein
MSQDLEEYHDIIEQLKPMINEPEFNQVLNQVAANVPKKKRFLLKMELKRLARPCTRVIDLRGRVDGKCRMYQYQGQEHSLDDLAIEVFERQVRSFGEYTIGVYEAVINTENNFRVMYKKQQEKNLKKKGGAQKNTPERGSYLAQLIEFGNFAHRSEERMNYAISIEVFSDLNKSIQATTIDVSVSGLKIKLSKEHLFKLEERLTIQFRGLENEHLLDKKQGVPYTVEGIERGRDDLRLNLKRVLDFPTPAFKQFFERFIHGNKRRYKVNLDNTFDAIHNKTYEQYYIPNFASIPVYIEKRDGIFSPKYALSNDCNREDIDYWNDEVLESKIGYLLSDVRIRQCLAMPIGQQETYIYVFNHVKDEKIYFYSATHQELQAKPNLKSVFLGYGARKISWRIYKLQLTEMQATQSYLPLSIADSVNDSIKRQNQKTTPRLMARLQHLSHIALLTNITDEMSSAHYQKIAIKRDKLAQLKVFGHPRNRPPESVAQFRFKYINQRREKRFQLHTKVLLKYDNKVSECRSEDISVNGLKLDLELDLDNFFHGDVLSTVHLSFPQLQKVTDKYHLVELPYTLKHISKDRNTLHLSVISDEVNTTAKQFFEELIKGNRSQLKAYPEEESIPGIGEALRNIYANNVLNVGFFLRKKGVTFLPDAATTHSPTTRLTTLLGFQAEQGFLNLYPFYVGVSGKHDFIQSSMGKLKTNERPISRELFIAFDPSKDKVADAVKSVFIDQFTSDEQRRQFISQALIGGQFVAIKVFLARTGRPDIEKLQLEIDYVGVYAVHRAKILEKKLWNVSGVGDLIDVTDEVMNRYEFSPEKIEANIKTPAPHEIKKIGIELLLKV